MEKIICDLNKNSTALIGVNKTVNIIDNRIVISGGLSPRALTQYEIDTIEAAKAIFRLAYDSIPELTLHAILFNNSTKSIYIESKQKDKCVVEVTDEADLTLIANYIGALTLHFGKEPVILEWNDPMDLYLDKEKYNVSLLPDQIKYLTYLIGEMGKRIITRVNNL